MPRHDVNKTATAETRRKGAENAAEAKRRKREEERALLTEARRGASGRRDRDTVPGRHACGRRDRGAAQRRSEAVKLRAALGVLEILDAAELREMSDRLSRLEEIANANGRPT